MRLVELNPQWLMRDGKRIGFIFRCPLDPNNARRLQTCFFQPLPSAVQWESIKAVIGDERWIVQQCKESCGWAVHVPPAPTNPVRPLDPEQASFETLTVTPSLDGSAGGNWHGFITNGAIVGGI